MLSQLVEGSDVYRLAEIFESLDLLDEVISADEVIDDRAADNNLEHAVSDWLLLELSLPLESLHLDLSEDLCTKGVEVGLWSPWLDLEDNEGLSNWLRLSCLLGSCLLGLVVKGLLGGRDLWTKSKVKRYSLRFGVPGQRKINCLHGNW